jgi:hypothetical protein
MSAAKRIVFVLAKARVNGYTRKDGTFVKEHVDSRAEQTPETMTQNDGYGYHGEALHQSVREKHGPDQSPYTLSESGYRAHSLDAQRRFSEAAHKLVRAGHFPDHDQARDYLDSKHGRHLHDGATFHDGDISKVPWLANDVHAYKRSNGVK